MNKSFFLALCVAALLTACNTAEKPAPVVEPVETVVNIQAEQPKQEPAAQKVEVDNNGVKINLQDKNGNAIEIKTGDPK